MMYGSRVGFDYAECNDCGSVQIIDVPSPETLAKHYPVDYYAFAKPTGLRRWLETQRDRAVAGRFSWGGSLIARKRPDRVLGTILRSGIKPQDRILDVGCGTGHLLDRLAGLGFRSLQGVDPFVPADGSTRAGVPITKGYLAGVTGQFDVVMFNHALEHVPDPGGDLNRAAALLVPGGRCIVRIPTTSSLAWRSYREHWAQLDAPRHLLIPSRHGMSVLAERAGLVVVDIVDDSSGFQFEVSELYKRDISIFVPGSTTVSPEIVDAFTRREAAEFEARARQLNELGDGDQAMFVLARSS